MRNDRWRRHRRSPNTNHVSTTHPAASRIGALLVMLSLMALVACGGGDGNDSGSSSNANLPTSIGKGEGELNVIAWEGYTQPEWVKPFEQQTGCKVNAKYGGSSDEMVTLMRQGGGSQYDLVSASGDASLRLIRGGDVAPVNVDLIPSYKDFIPQLKSPPHNTVDGKHYGVSLQWGPNTLIYDTTKGEADAHQLVGALRREVQGSGHSAR